MIKCWLSSQGDMIPGYVALTGKFWVAFWRTACSVALPKSLPWCPWADAAPGGVKGSVVTVCFPKCQLGERTDLTMLCSSMLGLTLSSFLGHTNNLCQTSEHLPPSLRTTVLKTSLSEVCVCCINHSSGLLPVSDYSFKLICVLFFYNSYMYMRARSELFHSAPLSPQFWLPTSATFLSIPLCMQYGRSCSAPLNIQSN